MKRLTEDLHTAKHEYAYSTCVKDASDREGIALSALGRVEDIEDELGISMPVVYDALKYGIYVLNVVNEPVLVKVSLQFQKAKNAGWIFRTRTAVISAYSLSDLGKTWALEPASLPRKGIQ